MIGTWFALFWVTALLPMSEQKPAKQEFKTKVEGSSYRIVVRGDRVTVKNKALIAGRTMDDRDRRRVAVRQATGCNIIDEMWFDATMTGTLACSAE